MRNVKGRWIATVAAAGLALTLTACSGGSTPASPAPEPSTAAPTGYAGEPASLEFWGSNPALSKLADLFNTDEADTGITVKFTEQAGGVQLIQNLRNAAAAKTAPCVFDAQTEDVTSLASDEILRDITDLVSPYESDYSANAWAAASTGDQVFGVPAASIPAFMIYNARVFAEAGLEYPTTWDEFIEAGKVLNANGVKIYNLAGEDYTTYVYLAWQAGAQWWQLDGDGWKVDIDSKQTAKAAKVLQQMLDNDIVSKISYAEYAAMMQDYNDGKIASRQLSTWQTKGQQANLTTGLGEWEPAPNPTFTGEDEANVSFTRVYGISSDCENPEAAAYFAHWISTNEAAVSLIASPTDGASWFPAVADPTSYIEISKPVALLGEHADKWQPVVEDAVQTQKGDWTYGPDASAAFKALADQWGKAVAGEIKVADIAPFMQTWVEDDLKQAGMTVK